VPLPPSEALFGPRGPACFACQRFVREMSRTAIKRRRAKFYPVHPIQCNPLVLQNLERSFERAFLLRRIIELFSGANREKFREILTRRQVPSMVNVRPWAGYRAFRAPEPQVEQGTNREISDGMQGKPRKILMSAGSPGAWSTETCGYCPTKTQSEEQRDVVVSILRECSFRSLAWLTRFSMSGVAEAVYSTPMWVRRVIEQFGRQRL
jgi:hypothetical protein